MKQQEIINRLMNFGLTRQESIIYITLCQSEALTGYETAKITGISRSNAYSSLAGLVDKGAAYTEEAAVIKYLPVPTDEFCSNKIRKMRAEQEYLKKHMPEKKADAEGYITIEGYQNIVDKIKNMIAAAEQRVYISMSAKLLFLFRDDLEELIRANKKVVIISNKNPKLAQAITYQTDDKGNQIRVIVDSATVLTGDFGEANNTCLYSGQINFVAALKEAMSNEIKIIELTGGKE